MFHNPRRATGRWRALAVVRSRARVLWPPVRDLQGGGLDNGRYLKLQPVTQLSISRCCTNHKVEEVPPTAVVLRPRG